MPEIRYESVTKRFGEQTAVDDLTLTVEDGELFTFVGPSGCGKSTILAITSGLEAPTSGRLLLDGERTDTLSPADRDVAMVFQSYALYPHMRVRENLAFPLAVRKRSKHEIDEEVRRVAERLGLTELLDRKPGALSGGQRQRVALGRALIRRPKVFLMDEPLSNLDAALRIETRGEIARIHRESGATTLYVTHDQEEAMALSDRIAVLRDGRLQQCAAPMELYERPANRFVAGFIGSPPINFAPADALADRIDGLPSTSGAVELGIRPTDLRATAADDGGAEVSRVGPMGAQTWVRAAVGDRELRALLEDGAGVSAGDRIALAAQPGRVHRFDAESGERIDDA